MTSARPDTPIAEDGTSKFRRHSVAWRLILPVCFALAAAIAVMWLIVPRVIESDAIEEAIAKSQAIAEQFKTIRAYYTERVVAKVITQGAMTAAIDHKTNPNAIPLPATMIQDLSDLLAQRDTTIKLYSKFPFPNRKDRQLDPFQREAWDFLSANPKATFSRAEMQGDRRIVRAAVADVMTAQGCVNCHNTIAGSPRTDWKLGDVRGVLEIDSVIDNQLANGAALSRSMVAGTVVAGSILLAILLFAARSVIAPLGAIVRQMKKLVSGDFNVALPGLTRKDEIGDIAKAVEVFRAHGMEVERMRSERAEHEQQSVVQRKAELQRLADEFQQTVGTIVGAVSATAGNLESAASTLAATAKTTEQLSKSVATASEEESTNVQSVASATEEMTSSAKEIARQVLESSRIAGHAVQQAAQTDARINQLSQAAGRIGDVVKLITAIAEQTNLLALNATIEAARAGEAGKGFAVVAQEVKALAAQTAKATDEISGQIAHMQTATGDSVSAIKEIGATINRIAEIATIVAAAAEEQGATTSEIAHNVQRAAHGTSQVAGNIADVSRGASETGSASAQVLTSAQSLSSESTRLRHELEKFLATIRAA